jgi:hypothetical protein
VLLLGVSTLGLLLALYLIGLHHDAVLYARTVNAVRAHFVGKLQPEDPRPTMVLPIDQTRPSFTETKLRFIVAAFALVDGFYAGAAAHVYWLLRGGTPSASACGPRARNRRLALFFFRRFARKQEMKRQSRAVKRRSPKPDLPISASQSAIMPWVSAQYIDRLSLSACDRSARVARCSARLLRWIRENGPSDDL